jgi:hypothetical protein
LLCFSSVLTRRFGLGIPFCTFGLENIRYWGKLCNIHLRFWFVSSLLSKKYIYLLCDFGLISWYILCTSALQPFKLPCPLSIHYASSFYGSI